MTPMTTATSTDARLASFASPFRSALLGGFRSWLGRAFAVACGYLAGRRSRLNSGGPRYVPPSDIRIVERLRIAAR